MRKTLPILIFLVRRVLPAQTTPARSRQPAPPPSTSTPDQAQLTVGVVTQGATAQEAGTLNATLATTVQNALKGVLGTNGTIQTVGYSVYPRYSTAKLPTIVGYTASNTVQVTTTNLEHRRYPDRYREPGRREQRRAV